MEITKETQLSIINQEINLQLQTRYLIEIRYRVNKKLGNEEAVKACEVELVKIEQALDEYEKIKAEL